MAPPSVLGSEARSASLANTGCGLPIGNIAGACKRDGDSRHRRCGRSLLARWRHRLGGRRLALRGQRLISVHGRCGPRSRPVPARRSRQASDWAKRAARRWARPAPAPSRHRRRRPAPRAGLRPGPPRRSAGTTPEQRVRDRGDPRGIGRLALRSRGAFEVAAKRQRPGRSAGTDRHRPRSRKLRHDDPRESLSTWQCRATGASVTTACASLDETTPRPPHRPCRKCGRRRDTCPPPHYRARRAHPRSAPRASCTATRDRTRSPCG